MEDRPIIVKGGSEMATVTLPRATNGGGGSFTVQAQSEGGPFKTIELSNAVTGEIISRPANGDWTVTVK